jgi:F-type H+-transporting ATPase subunit delta
MDQNQNGADGALQPYTADVGSQRVARIYAEALLNAAAKQQQADAVFEELDALVRDVFPADPTIEAFLASSAISRERKAGILRSVFGGRVSELFLNFLLVLNSHDRLYLLRPMREAARALRDQRAHRMRVWVRSAVPLADGQRERLKVQLQETFHQEPILETGVDPNLLGGLVVQVGDWVYDGSVRTQLETIQHQLIARSSHEIQSGRDRFSS